MVLFIYLPVHCLLFPCLSPILTKAGCYIGHLPSREIETRYAFNKYLLNKGQLRKQCQDSLTDGILASVSMAHVRRTDGYG